MKNTPMLIASIITACCCISCSKYEISHEESDLILFSSHITNVQSRVEGNTWTDNDEIGIFMQSENGTEANKKYLAQSDGTLTAAPDNELYFPLKGTASFKAYYPYSSTLQDKNVSLSVANQGTPSAIDFLYSNNATNISTNENIELNFSHQLSKFVVNIKKDETITDTKGIIISLTGMNTTATFDLDNGTITSTNNKATINMKVNDEGTLAEAIVLPIATLENIKMNFTFDGKTIAWPLVIQESSTIEKGCKYTFTATLSIKQQQQSVQMGITSITDWTEKAGGDFNIEFEENGSTKPKPEPETTQSTILYEETCGNPQDAKYAINEYTNWTDTHKLTCSNPQVAAGKDNAVVRNTSSLNGHIWFSSKKNSAFRVSGFNTTDYKSVELSYDIAGTKSKDQNCLKVSTDKDEIVVPSKIFDTTDTYQHVTVSLPAGFTYIQFTSDATTNTAGYRLDNIKVIGKK